ncbi:homologous-pairing protein 2 homolog isoform X2 [Rhinatrema bivittatum]|uniref:homologous-pairing protein 2 homolog isoform X2 n=1 Tax=Rhinatrema bivittatum TaxID=194408 RepID=UPI0011265B1B|nr:homologous-pairing protein 2 homolog isoform X2 [Rhinatrema bivittatum]
MAGVDAARGAVCPLQRCCCHAYLTGSGGRIRRHGTATSCSLSSFWGGEWNFLRQNFTVAPRASGWMRPAVAVILKYLNDQNRPYSTQDVFGNLQREHGLGKTAVVKAMEQLAQQGKIKEKVYGKQKIYFADQDQFPSVSDTELKRLDSQIAEMSSQVQSIQQSCRQLDAELKELNSSMTTPEMAKEIAALKKECTQDAEKLERIRCATNHVTPEEKEKATDLFDAILEGYPKSKKQFFEEVGIETDEDHKVTLPDV